MEGFRACLAPGVELAGAAGTRAPTRPSPPRRSSAAIWQVLHRYIERGAARRPAGAAPQLTYFALAPFLGAPRAAAAALATAQTEPPRTSSTTLPSGRRSSSVCSACGGVLEREALADQRLARRRCRSSSMIAAPISRFRSGLPIT